MQEGILQRALTFGYWAKVGWSQKTGQRGSNEYFEAFWHSSETHTGNNWKLMNTVTNTIKVFRTPETH